MARPLPGPTAPTCVAGLGLILSWLLEIWVVLPPSVFPEMWKENSAREPGALADQFLPNNGNKYFQQTAAYLALIVAKS